MISSFEYITPVKVVFGPGKIKEAGQILKNYGNNALIVSTGDFFLRNGLIEKLQKVLKEAGVDSSIFHDVSPNPLAGEVDKGAKVAKQNNCNVIIGLGGGSAMDAAKGIAVAAGHDKAIWEFIKGNYEVTEKTLSIITITTTSGTGSHVTPFIVITNPEFKEKPGFGCDFTWAKVAIVDPELMLSMPVKVTAATGFDVFAHSLESYTGRAASPIVNLYSEEAMRIVGRYLRKVVSDGKDIEARTAMAWADTLAGQSISIGFNTLCHSIGHSAGGIYGSIAHGELLASLTPYTFRYSMKSNPEKFKNVGIFLRDECISSTSKSVDELLEESAQEVEKLIKDIGLNVPLRDLGIKEADFESIADGVMGYMTGLTGNDSNTPTKEDILDILKKAY